MARREHTRGELQRKLALRGHAEKTIGGVLDELAQQSLLDERRFVEVFVRSRAGRGQGPVRIAQEMRARGVPDELVRTGLPAQDSRWAQHAREVLAKKFPAAIGDLKDRAKRIRFLEYRGFSHAQIAAALVGGANADHHD